MAETELRAFSGARISGEGNIGNEPRDFSREKDGSAVSFSLAVSYRNYGDEDTETHWFQATVRGTQAQNFIASGIGKGDRIVFEGGLFGHRYETKDGDEVESWDININFIGLALRYRGAKSFEVEGEEEDRPRSRRSSDKSSSRRSSRSRDEDEDEDEDEEEAPKPRARRRASASTEEEAAPATRRRRAAADEDEDDAPRSTGRRSRRSRVADAGDNLDD